jgi:hypothetical protein
VRDPAIVELTSRALSVLVFRCVSVDGRSLMSYIHTAAGGWPEALSAGLDPQQQRCEC